MAHVFISYSRKDRDFAQELIEQLRTSKLLHWIDSEELRGGDNWEQKIDDAIREAFAVLLVMSPDAKSSEYVTYEWAFAFGANVQVVPIYFRSIEEWHPKIHPTKIQFIDFRDGKHPYLELVGRLVELKEANHNEAGNSDYLEKKKHIALEGDNERERQAAIHDIERSKHQSVRDTLAEIIDKAHLPDTFHNAGVVLARYSDYTDTRAIPSLIEAVKGNTQYRDKASQAIKHYGSEAIKELIKLLESDSLYARNNATYILGDMNAREAIPKLLELLNSESSSSWIASAEILSKFGETQAIPRLIELILEKNFLELKLVAALAQYKDESSIEALIYSIKKKNDYQSLTLQVLEQFGEKIVPELKRALQELDCIEYNAYRLGDFVKLAGQIKSRELIEDLVRLIDCEEDRVRRRVPIALGEINDTSSLHIIGEKLISDSDKYVRINCVNAMALIDDERTIDYILLALGDSEIDVRQRAVGALGYKKSAKTEATLIELLEHDDINIQAKAYHELRQFDSEKAKTAVEEWEKRQSQN